MLVCDVNKAGLQTSGCWQSDDVSKLHKLLNYIVSSVSVEIRIKRFGGFGMPWNAFKSPEYIAPPSGQFYIATWHDSQILQMMLLCVKFQHGVLVRENITEFSTMNQFFCQSAWLTVGHCKVGHVRDLYVFLIFHFTPSSVFLSIWPSTLGKAHSVFFWQKYLQQQVHWTPLGPDGPQFGQHADASYLWKKLN